MKSHSNSIVKKWLIDMHFLHICSSFCCQKCKLHLSSNHLDTTLAFILLHLSTTMVSSQRQHQHDTYEQCRWERRLISKHSSLIKHWDTKKNKVCIVSALHQHIASSLCISMDTNTSIMYEGSDVSLQLVSMRCSQAGTDTSSFKSHY